MSAPRSIPLGLVTAHVGWFRDEKNIAFAAVPVAALTPKGQRTVGKLTNHWQPERDQVTVFIDGTLLQTRRSPGLLKEGDSVRMQICLTHDQRIEATGRVVLWR